MARLGDAWRGHAGRGAAMAAILSAAIALPVHAATCHHYSVWRYPWPQHCGVARPMRPISSHHFMGAPKMVGEPEIPLPGLARADLDGGVADEATRGRLLLRAALEAPDAH